MGRGGREKRDGQKSVKKTVQHFGCALGKPSSYCPLALSFSTYLPLSSPFPLKSPLPNPLWHVGGRLVVKFAGNSRLVFSYTFHLATRPLGCQHAPFALPLLEYKKFLMRGMFRAVAGGDGARWGQGKFCIVANFNPA